MWGPGWLKLKASHRVCHKILGRETGWDVGEAMCLFGPGRLEEEEFLKKKKRKERHSAAV